MKKPPLDPDQRSPEETARRSRETLRRMIATPPTKHAEEPKRARARALEPRDPWKGLRGRE
jgi:hypothetical protein